VPSSNYHIHLPRWFWLEAKLIQNPNLHCFSGRSVPEAEVRDFKTNVVYLETGTRPGDGNNKSFPVGYR
jgi:hypothetical protein